MELDVENLVDQNEQLRKENVALKNRVGRLLTKQRKLEAEVNEAIEALEDATRKKTRGRPKVMSQEEWEEERPGC